MAKSAVKKPGIKDDLGSNHSGFSTPSITKIVLTKNPNITPVNAAQR